MRKYTFAALALCIMAIGITAGALFSPSASHAAEVKAYTPGLVKQELAAGNTVFVIYGTDWCITCMRQERTINKLRADNPKYDENMTFIRVDYDKYKNKDISRSYKIPRRSTLLVLRGDEELGRSVAGTGTTVIKALMDAGL